MMQKVLLIVILAMILILVILTSNKKDLTDFNFKSVFNLDEQYNLNTLQTSTIQTSTPCPIEKKSKYDLSHLTQEKQIVWGPIQDDEALFLYGLIKAVRPKLLVEFGFSHGVSATNFLKALDPDAKMYSYDIHEYNPKAEPYKDSRFKFLLKSQTDFQPADIENRTIDLAYLDAGHSLSIETALFPKVIKLMSPNGIIVVHDTGLHVNDVIDQSCSCDFPNLCGSQHQRDERQFINWINDNYPEWQTINIHSFIEYRHGLTIFQRKYKLSTEEVDKKNCKYAKAK